MSSVQDIYNRLFTGDKLQIRCDSEKAFHSLRTALCKKNQICVALDMTDGSIVATFDEASGLGTFQLAQSTRKKSQNKWEIVETAKSEDNPLANICPLPEFPRV